MKLETLYTLDSKNKIRVFECRTLGQQGTPMCLVQTKTGVLDGKLITQETAITVGKQKRSIHEQVEFEANSLWEAKLDEGYKSIDQLRKHCNDIGEYYDLKNLFEKNPTAAITNKNWDYLPMLAKKLKDIKKPIFPMYAQPKLNGVRCLVKYEFTNVEHLNGIKLCSRGGQYYEIAHLQHQLYDLYRKIEKEIGSANFLLDGEIYKHGVPLQEISGAARKEEEIGLFNSNNWLEYHIYDVINLDKSNQDQGDRLENLISLQLLFRDNKYIKFVETSAVDNLSEVKQLHDNYISQGYEGLILRKQDGLYEFNQRSYNLLKVKEYQDEEFEIIGNEVDYSKSIEDSFVFVLKNNINDLTFKARPTGTGAQKVEWNRLGSELFGKKATIRFFERSKEGLPLQGSVQHKISKVLIEHIRPYGE